MTKLGFYFLLLLIAAGIPYQRIAVCTGIFCLWKKGQYQKQIIAYLILSISVPILGKLVLRLISKTKWMIYQFYV